eukprot:m.181746 g.181746  ORF g.181746 m.181746 type:complete len:518 (+) comp25462_c4_seq5:49-1602(+)
MLSFLLLCCATAFAKPPHILVILGDDLGHADLSSVGAEIDTPNLDNLIDDGILLTNHHVQEVCSPTRGALLTGRYPMRWGLLHHVFNTQVPFGLYTNETLVATEMKKAGYSTHAIGKWHLGFSSWNNTPTYRGFDTFFGFYSGAQDYFKHTEGGCDKSSGKDLRNDTRPVPISDEYSAIQYTSEATRIIKKHANEKPDEPFFMYLAYQSVHSPAEVPSFYEDKYKKTIPNKERRLYAGMVTALDQGIGNVTAALKSTGMWDDTFVVFSADNGGPTHAFSGIGACNYPLRGGKHTLFQGGVQSRAFVSGGISEVASLKGTKNNALMHVTDWFPTLARLATGKRGLGEGPVALASLEREGFPLDGHDAWDALVHGAASSRTEFLINYDPTVDTPSSDCCGYAGLRQGDLKLLINPGTPNGWYECADPTADSVPPGPLQGQPVVLEFNGQKRNFSLFNVTSDPYELVDLAAAMPDVVSSMSKRIQYYIDQALPEGNNTCDPRGNPASQTGENKGYFTPWM